MLFIAFWFNAPGDKQYAPKVGMTVTIVDTGFTKHDKNPSHESPFNKEWKLVQWVLNDDNIWDTLLHSQSKYSRAGNIIEPMDVLTTSIVCALKYSTHSRSYGTVQYQLLSPTEMNKRWEINGNDSKDGASLKVSVSHIVSGGKVKLKPKSKEGAKKGKNGK